MTAHWIVGDTLSTLRKMPDCSVDLVLTSPPFLALRSYLPADHPDKAFEIGSEATPAAFIDTLLDLTDELARIVTPHGSIAIELGDTYSGSGGAGGDYSEDGLRAGQPAFDGAARRTRTHNMAQGYSGGSHGHTTKEPGVMPYNGGRGWPLAKSLCLIPESFRWALVYGRNPFNGRTCVQWRARNVVRWVRPNPPVGALGDKYRPATSEMVIACLTGKRWFDLDAVRQPSQDTAPRTTNGPRNASADASEVLGHYDNRTTNPAGAPPLDWWNIPTQPYAGSHYATWPDRLCATPIESMCPRHVCRTCGKPRERITERDPDAVEANIVARDGRTKDGRGDEYGADGYGGFTTTTTTTLGWTDCGHGNYRSGVVLDPFAGSGTTLAVATGHGRDAVGIDLDRRNVDLARERIGPMFFQETTVEDWAEL